MLKRHEVEILLKAGHSKAEVARLAGVSLCSVKRIAQESPVVHVDDAAERSQRQIGRLWFPEILSRVTITACN
jgi:DNA invertase Pin-like site-specific DNA recombinase